MNNRPLPRVRRPLPGGLCRYGYSVSFDYRRAMLIWRGHHGAGVTTSHGLYNLEPKGGVDEGVAQTTTCSLPSPAPPQVRNPSRPLWHRGRRKM